MSKLDRFPHSERFPVGSATCLAGDVISRIGPQLTSHRREIIANVVAKRTYNITPVMENIYDRGNISAVLRSAEAFGLQSAHIVEISDKFKDANRVSKGAEKWLDLFRWQSTADCLADLCSKGYRILATSLQSSRPIEDFDFTQPTALVFGNEKDGVSEEMLEESDDRVFIPMQGFVQSFNISVAAALSFYHAYCDRMQRLGKHGDLTDQQREILTASYYLRTQDSAEKQLAQEFC